MNHPPRRRVWWRRWRRIRQVIQGSKWVVAGAIVFREDGRMLLIKHRWRGSWEYPIGMTDPNESPLDAAYRELFEEVGLQPRIDGFRLVSVDFFRRNTPNGNLVLTFGTTVDEHERQQIAIDPFEVSDYRWVTREEALGLVPAWLKGRLAALYQAYDADRPVYLHKGVPILAEKRPGS